MLPSLTDAVAGETPTLMGPVMTNVADVWVSLSKLVGLFCTPAVRMTEPWTRPLASWRGSVDGRDCGGVVGSAALNIARGWGEGSRGRILPGPIFDQFGG